MTRQSVGRRWRLVALLLAAWIGCARDGASPAETVDRYFGFLARDPIRTLPLLTPEFHVRHGLHVGTTAEARRYQRGERGVPSASARDGEPAGDAAKADAEDRHALAWLGVQMREPFRALRDRISVVPIDIQEHGDGVSVTVRVQGGAKPPFEQRFDLVRAAAGRPWRIDRIEQRGVADDALAVAFVAHPTEATRISLERVLRRGALSPGGP
jgi:hypothetical protein